MTDLELKKISTKVDIHSGGWAPSATGGGKPMASVHTVATSHLNLATSDRIRGTYQHVIGLRTSACGLWAALLFNATSVISLIHSLQGSKISPLVQFFPGKPYEGSILSQPSPST